MKKQKEEKPQVLLFECENGRRWQEVIYPATKKNGKIYQDSKDGGTCNFSGCLNDHKIKLMHTVDLNSKLRNKWFRGWKRWEGSPVYKSLRNKGTTKKIKNRLKFKEYRDNKNGAFSRSVNFIYDDKKISYVETTGLETKTNPGCHVNLDMYYNKNFAKTLVFDSYKEAEEFVNKRNN